MTQPHQDNLRLAALITEHDQANGNTPDTEGKAAGYDNFALLVAARRRAELMAEGNGTLRKTLSPQQFDELRRLLAAMWKDGFVVGARSQQSSD